MNLEQLQALSDSELNELSAVKVMGKLYQNGKMWEKVEGKGINGHRWIKDWNPTADMNDAMELEEIIADVSMRYVRKLSVVCSIEDVTNLTSYGQLWDLIHATPRQRTIASILAKEGIR